MIVRILAVIVLALGLAASAGAQTKGPNGGIVMKADDQLAAPIGTKARIVFNTQINGLTLQARFVTD